MITNIDIDQSKIKDRIILKSIISNTKELLIASILCAIFLVILLTDLFRLFPAITMFSIVKYAFGLLLVVVIYFLFIHYTLKLKSLTRIKGKDYETNKSIIKEIIKNRNWKISVNTDNLLIARTTPNMSINWQLTVIFDQEYILICSFHLGKNDIISPLSFRGNQKETQQLRIDFENKINNTA